MDQERPPARTLAWLAPATACSAAWWLSADLRDAIDDLIRLRPPRLTGGFRYLRFHGHAGKYQGRYGARALAPFARELSRFARRGEGDAFVYFNNDVGGQAVARRGKAHSSTSPACRRRIRINASGTSTGRADITAATPSSGCAESKA